MQRPKVFFKTFGCRTNLYDTQIMRQNLKDFEHTQDENIKIDRLNRLQELLNKQQIDFNQSFINREVTILVENKSKENENVFFGRTEYSQAVMLDKKDFKVNIGDLVNVKILDANLRTLSGEVLNIVNK